MRQDFAVIILAAGKGKRMHSKLPKVLHPICGRPMLGYILDTVNFLKEIKKKIVVVGYRHNLLREFLKGAKDIKIIRQKRLIGTADAVKLCKNLIPAKIENILVIYADNPLLTKSTLTQLLSLHLKTNAAITLLSANLKDPSGYGRIIRDNLSNIIRISEQDRLGYNEKEINEINVGATCFKRDILFRNINKIKPNTNNGEYYLTDIVQIFSEMGEKVESLNIEDPLEAQGVNSYEDLQDVNSILRRHLIQQNLDKGVEIIDPQTTFIDNNTTIGEKTIIYPFTIIENNVKIGRNCRVGPFCHLRPGVIIKDNVEVGNFVEVVRSTLDSGIKVKHFSYLGDSQIGKFVNIGAGAVTANFDGKSKNITKIKDRAFIGSDTVLVAPVEVGKKAVTGAGSVVTKDVPSGKVVIGVPAKPLKLVK